MRNEFDVEEPTVRVPHETLSEVSAKWRAQLALEEKQLRSAGSGDATQPLEVIR